MLRSVLTASLLALAAPVAAQTVTPGAAPQEEPARSSSRGFFLGAALNGSSIALPEVDANDVDGGSGINLSLGYGITPQFGLLLSVAGANMHTGGGGSYALGQADVAARFSFANRARAFVPYLEAGFTGLSEQGDVDGETVEIQGTGITGAAGLNFFINPKLALDVNLRLTQGEFDTVRTGGRTSTNPNGVEVTTARFNLGFSWFPGGPR